MRKKSTYDPNSHLDPETIQRGLAEARKALAVTGLPWRPATHPGSQSLLWLYQTWDWHLIYVRVTSDEVAFAGVGERPQVLDELRDELRSRFEAVVRVHLHTNGEVQLIGFTNVIAKLIFMAREWNQRMLDGCTARELLELAGGKPAVLTANWVYIPEWHKPKTDDELIASFKAEHREPRTEMTDVREGETEDEFVKRRFAEFRSYPERPAHGHLRFGLAAEGLADTESSINFAALAASTTWNDDYDILTCSCGSSGCAGTGRGSSVTHESGLTVWWVHFVEPKRFIVFDQHQYRTEIFTKIREALRFHATLPLDVRFGDIGFESGRENQRRWIEAALVEAEAFHQSEPSINPMQQAYAQQS